MQSNSIFQQVHSLHAIYAETKLKTKKSYTVLSLGFLQDLSSLVQRPLSYDGQRTAAAALDLGHSQQAELEEDLYRGSKIRKKTLPNPTNPQIYNPNSNCRDVQLLSKKSLLQHIGKVYNLDFYPLH